MSNLQAPPSTVNSNGRQLPNWITSYLRMVEQTEPPERFHLWVAITMLAAMLGRKCTVQLGPNSFYPGLYTILIGGPGVRKSTAIEYGTDLLREVGKITLAPDAVTKEQLCQEIENAQDTVPIGNTMFTHSSLFVVASELVVFIKESDNERLGYLCQLYDGRDRFEYKTKTSGNNYIVNPGLWILGATTPNWIEISMKQLGVGGGMTSRTIFVYAADKGKHIPATQMKPFDPVLRSKLMADLLQIKRMAGHFKFTPEANLVYENWYIGPYKNFTIGDSRFESYWQRLPSMVIKVSMVISAAKRNNMIIMPEDVVGAIRVFDHIHPEMSQAFGGLGQNILGKQTEKIREMLRQHGSCPKSYIMHVLRHDLNEWDYLRARNSLLAERFCSQQFDQERGEHVLTISALPPSGGS